MTQEPIHNLNFRSGMLQVSCMHVSWRSSLLKLTLLSRARAPTVVEQVVLHRWLH